MTMTKSWIKICGTTNYEDALLAWEAGADAIGFIFVEQSSRYITPESAHKISNELARPVERIGVVADWTTDQMVDLVCTCSLSGLQLHGNESPKVVRELRNELPMERLGKTLHVNSAGPLIEKVRQYQNCGLDNLLLDSAVSVSGKSGGTGTSFDWTMASSALLCSGNKLPIIIAGGLTPQNVGDAIDLFHPFGVDVASSIERERGKKDPDKLRGFIHAVRTADSQKVEIA